MSDGSTPETDTSSTGNTSSPLAGPSYTTPTPNPRDANDIGKGERPGFEYSQNPGVSENRLHPDDTRHPTNGRITRPLQNRSK